MLWSIKLGAYQKWPLMITMTNRGSGNPLQCSCQENPVDGGAWRATVHGATESRTRLSDLTFFLYYKWPFMINVTNRSKERNLILIIEREGWLSVSSWCEYCHAFRCFREQKSLTCLELLKTCTYEPHSQRGECVNLTGRGAGCDAEHNRTIGQAHSFTLDMG